MNLHRDNPRNRYALIHQTHRNHPTNLIAYIAYVYNKYIYVCRLYVVLIS